MKKAIIIGTGRSGTNWIGRILAAHPECVHFGEASNVFGTAMAIGVHGLRDLVPKMIRQMNAVASGFPKKHSVFKAHPAIWAAEDLAKLDDDIVFVGIQRDAVATVASMLAHAGVSGWDADQLPVPCPFIGKTEKNADGFGKLAAHVRHAIRVRSHTRELRRLKKALGKDRIRVVNFDTLVKSPTRALKPVEDLLGLTVSFKEVDFEQPDAATLTKWKRLSPSVVGDITKVMKGRCHE
jgi:hypothetical protein